MYRQTDTFPLADRLFHDIQQRMLNWSKQFSILLFLDSNSYDSPYGKYDCLLAAGALDIISQPQGDLLQYLQQFHTQHKDWLFGHIAYEYKDLLEHILSSSYPATIGFPLAQFFRPQIVCYIEKGSGNLTIECVGISPLEIFNAIINTSPLEKLSQPKLSFQQRINKDTYLNSITTLRRHIADGDCYEINFCNEGYCESAVIDPVQVFNALNTLSPAPFAAYYRLYDKYMMCASPERYIRKQGQHLLCQPIKGTARRDANELKDIEIKTALYHNIKERAENVMIVDLMRSDLAHTCIPGTIQVDELFGIYTFPQVHQMISTISGKLKPDTPFTDAIGYSFPMGSMTGAPKVMVMQLIELYEQSRRELYSGTVGYISPQGDMDFNVVIRSLFYNATSQYLSYHTGGAITFDSEPQQEWDEMRLKAWALERLFS
ncbi:MAG: anthranilate synthase component I family protein [Bacteroidota bacterium]